MKINPIIKIITFVFLSASVLLCQVSRDKYPFNETDFDKSITVQVSSQQEGIHPIIFKRRVDFTYVEFKDRNYFHKARFHGTALFAEAKFAGTAFFQSARFDSTADFHSVKFNKGANFEKAYFGQTSYFNDVDFNQFAVFSNSTFKDSLSFLVANFDKALFNNGTFFKAANFRHGEVKGTISFNNTDFVGNADFTGRKFINDANFTNARFSKKTSFSKTSFDKSVDFSNATFRGNTEFYFTHFAGEVNFANTLFYEPVDLRWADFSDVEKIVVNEEIQFPPGKLFINWKDFAGKIELPETGQNLQTKYHEIEKFYLKIKENFKAQGETDLTDAVMYDMARAKQRIVGGFWMTVYGWIFGWGYKPWRFILYVVLPVILFFSLVWYKHYYHVLFKLFYKHEQEEIESDGIAQSESVLQKIWRTLHFSTSVLLSFRFKKEWIIDHGHFLHLVSLEWIIGVLLYILFALLIEGTRFGFIKSLLGFG